ncbi:MAG: hypothetical protein AAF938_23565 [Myxococcota bacterium]
MSKFMKIATLLMTALAVACGDASVKGAETDVPEDGKFDRFFAPTEHGDAEPGVTYVATFSPDTRFHAWDLDLGSDASVTLSTGSETGEELDTVMYVYRRNDDGTFGRYLHRADDPNPGDLWAGFDALALEAGSYRFLVKAYSSDTEGDFTFTLTCPDGCGAAPATTFECRFGVDGSPFLQYDVTDPYRDTPAQLLGELTADNIADADSELIRISGQAARRDGWATIEEYLDNVDEGTLEIYELSWFSTAYEWVRGFSGGNEFGYIYDYGFDGPVAEVSDGDIAGCRDDECSFRIEHSFPNASSDLLGEPLATLEDTYDASNPPTGLELEQIRVLLVHETYFSQEEVASASLEDLFDASDDNDFAFYAVGEAATWIQFYGGDNEVGGFFEAGTTNLVGVVGDGEISACMPTN